MKSDRKPKQLILDISSWNDIFQRLDHDRLVTVETREILKTYLQSQVATQDLGASNQSYRAYLIAALLSAKGIRHLRADDPISKVLELAAQLELPAQHRAAGDTWELLINMIDQL